MKAKRISLGQRIAQAYFDSAPFGWPAPIAYDKIPALAKVIDKTLKEAGALAVLEAVANQNKGRLAKAHHRLSEALESPDMPGEPEIAAATELCEVLNVLQVRAQKALTGAK